MGFCINCGQELANGAKYCANCGTVVSEKQNETEGQRRIVYDGELHKCPNCGEVINSFVSICPACGFEISNKRISSALQDFIKEVNECESLIASCPQAGKTGWASWHTFSIF